MIDLPDDELKWVKCDTCGKDVLVIKRILSHRSLVSVVVWKRGGKNLTKISEAYIRSSLAAAPLVGTGIVLCYAGSNYRARVMR